jgi:hypothetical protein
MKKKRVWWLRTMHGGHIYIAINLMPVTSITLYRAQGFGFGVYTDVVMGFLCLYVFLGPMMLQFVRPKLPRPPKREQRAEAAT